MRRCCSKWPSRGPRGFHPNARQHLCPRPGQPKRIGTNECERKPQAGQKREPTCGHCLSPPAVRLFSLFSFLFFVVVVAVAVFFWCGRSPLVAATSSCLPAREEKE